MRQQAPFTDRRLFDYCYACGDAITEHTRTIEHVPARVLLDRPYPENLATVFSCFACNNGSSANEQFVACLLEAVRVGSPDPRLFERDRVRDSVQKNKAIAHRLNSTFASDRAWDGEDNGRSLTVVIDKLARGHAIYDLADPRYGAPAQLAGSGSTRHPKRRLRTSSAGLRVLLAASCFPRWDCEHCCVCSTNEKSKPRG